MRTRARIAITTAAMTLLLGLAAAPAHAEGFWLQQHGRAESAACESGWDPSWAQWPNANRGGFVCTRSVPDPSANPLQTTWLYWFTTVVVAGGTDSTPTPRCTSLADSSVRISVLDARMEPADTGLVLSNWQTNFVHVDNPTGQSHTAYVYFLCPVGYRLTGVI